jgi:hypothetical protein
LTPGGVIYSGPTGKGKGVYWKEYISSRKKSLCAADGLSREFLISDRTLPIHSKARRPLTLRQKPMQPGPARAEVLES